MASICQDINLHTFTALFLVLLLFLLIYTRRIVSIRSPTLTVRAETGFFFGSIYHTHRVTREMHILVSRSCDYTESLQKVMRRFCAYIQGR